MTKAKAKTKKRPLIATVMRVKNEESYLRHALESLAPLGGPVLLLDDGSTDATPDIAKSFEFVQYQRQDRSAMDEGRDRTLLYRAAIELGPEWIFTLDGDEVLDPHTPGRMLRAVERCPLDVNVFEMFLAVMATPPGVRKEKWYGPVEPIGAWSMDRMFRVSDAVLEHEFKSEFESELHCGCVPAMQNRNKQLLNALIKYYGYETPEAVERKRAFYLHHDPANFPSIERMWNDRAKTRPVDWQDGASAPEMGKQNTVTY